MSDAERPGAAVDDDDLMRAGLRAVLSSDETIERRRRGSRPGGSRSRAFAPAIRTWC